MKEFKIQELDNQEKKHYWQKMIKTTGDTKMIVYNKES